MHHKQNSLEIKIGSARSNSPLEPTDDDVSVTSAVDRGYTAAEERYTRVARDDTLPLCHETTNHSEPPMSQDLLTGIGEKFTASQPAQADLARLLRDSLQTYGGPRGDRNKKWLPFNRLRALIDVDQVRQELEKVSLKHDDLQSYVTTICDPITYTDETHGHQLKTSFRSIFAILTLMRKVEDIPLFVNAKITDRFLPLTTEGSGSELTASLFPEKAWKIVEHWLDTDYDLFFLYQKYMLSPFFKLASKSSNEVFRYDLDPTAVLPFIYIGEKKLEGYHGSVQKIRIHPGHHDGLPVSCVS